MLLVPGCYDVHNTTICFPIRARLSQLADCLRRTRCRLPVAVDVTASFIEIMLNDAYLNPETEASRSDHELRLMYAMAVVRLVNGIVDTSIVVKAERHQEHVMKLHSFLNGYDAWRLRTDQKPRR